MPCFLTYHLSITDALFFADNLVSSWNPRDLWITSPQYSPAQNIPTSAWFPSASRWYSRPQWSGPCLPPLPQHHHLPFFSWTSPCNSVLFLFLPQYICLSVRLFSSSSPSTQLIIINSSLYLYYTYYNLGTVLII